MACSHDWDVAGSPPTTAQATSSARGVKVEAAVEAVLVEAAIVLEAASRLRLTSRKEAPEMVQNGNESCLPMIEFLGVFSKRSYPH